MESFVKECENRVRAGDDDWVAQEISRLNFRQIPRKFRLPLANLARRISRIPLGLKVLTPVVREDLSSQLHPPTPEERVEYAILLQRAGSTKEALKILSATDLENIPETFLYRAFCHFNMWDYQSALPFLGSYIQLTQDDYSRLIGNVNRGAALVALDRYDEAEKTLKNCIEIAQKGSFHRLSGNCHELLTHVHIFRNQLTEAQETISKAQQLIGNSKSLDALFVQKTASFFLAKKQNSTDPLKAFRQKALKWSHPESVREADMFSLVVKWDERLWSQLYFGTPFPEYRARMDRHLKSGNTQVNYPTQPDASVSFDISTDTLSDDTLMDFGSVPHKLTEVLLKDFYKPQNINNLFAHLFPEEFFDIFSSPNRIHQVVRRTRKWFKDQDYKATIKLSKLGYKMETNKDINFLVPLNRPKLLVTESRLHSLKAHFGDQEFTTTKASKVLKISSSSAQRLLDQGQKDGSIQRFGAGSRTVYWFAA